jgi:hypothetical protein
MFEKKWEMGGGGGGDGGQGVDGGVGQGQVAKEQISKEKREAQGARCQERRNAAPPSARKESPHLVTPEASSSHNVNLRDGAQDISSCYYYCCYYR